MTSTSSETKSPKRWHFQPDLSTQVSPYYAWPPNLTKIGMHVLKSWSFNDVRIYVLGFSVFIWAYLSPELSRCREFAFDWLAQIWARNFLTLLTVAGGLHLYFYTFGKQSTLEKYEAKPPRVHSKVFHFNNQVWDNMFWTLLGTVTILSAYEAVMMWAYANQFNDALTFEQSPIWFCLLIFLIPGWTGLHFYWQHRAFHIPILYKLGHHWHHKNINVGPWSGAAVHPIENLVWFTAVLVLLLIPSHPIHALFLMQLQVITAITTHVGFENLVINGKTKFRLGDFYHQLHHRFYDCNYGTMAGPWDRLFSTYHDGTAAGDEKIRQRRKMLASR